MSTNDGGPAFPFAYETQHPDEVGLHGGMTLRDYFAAKAMQGFMSRGDWSDKSFKAEAEGAYRVADAMLVARSTQGAAPANKAGEA